MDVKEGNRVVDVRGKPCPEPLMELMKAIRKEEIGKTLVVLTTDSTSARDIPEWVKRAGHELIAAVREGNHWEIIVRKKR